ncbi:MAG: DUF3224 domain-containing protein [Actinomycetota bacterium]|nr:DUF3224 domain-containing protein [Actinomycetota bacterium]
MSTYPNRAVATVTARSWEESRVAEADSSHAIARATFTTTYGGDIEGESICALLISYLAGDPDKPETLEGPYVGYEQVSATLGERSGTFVLSASGEHTGGVARTEVVVVPGSGTGELRGLVGAGSYAAGTMEYSLRLDYDFEPGAP